MRLFSFLCVTLGLVLFAQHDAGWGPFAAAVLWSLVFEYASRTATKEDAAALPSMTGGVQSEKEPK